MFVLNIMLNRRYPGILGQNTREKPKIGGAKEGDMCRKNKECQRLIVNSVCINTKCICELDHKLTKNGEACKPS